MFFNQARLLNGFLITTLVTLQLGCGGRDDDRVYVPGEYPAKNNGDGATVTLPDGTTKTYSHLQLVDAFVKALKQDNNTKDAPDYLVTRASTFQKNFVVFREVKYQYDYKVIDTPTCSTWDGVTTCVPGQTVVPVSTPVGPYYAVDLEGWVPGMSAMNFLEGNRSYEEVKIEGNDFRGMVSGLKFERKATGPKNLSKIKAFYETLKVEASAERLVRRYGLSFEKAIDASRFAFKISNSPTGAYNISDYDSFAKEFAGSSITEFETDYRNGDVLSLTNRIKRASELTGIGLEGINEFMKEVFYER